MTQTADASLIAPGLSIGSAPVPGRYRWIAAIAFCAEEYQPPSQHFPGTTVLRIPLDDNPERPMTKREIETAISGARTVARYLHAGQGVLVTCAQGRNRSGLVTALVLMDVHRVSADEAITRVRAARGPYALSNPQFVKLLRSVDGY